MERTGRVLRGTAAGVLQLLVATALQIVLMPLILRIAGQEALGVYAILLQIIGYLALLDIGITTAMGRALSQAGDDRPRFQALMRGGFRFLGLVGVAYALAGGALAFFMDRLFHLSGPLAAQARLAMLLLAGWGLLRFPLGLFGTALQAIQDLTIPPLLAVATNILRMALAILAVLAGFGIVGLAAASIIAEALTFGLLAWRFMRLRAGWFQPAGPLDRALLGEQLRFGVRAFWGNLAGRVVFSTDNLVVGNLYGPAAASVYYNTQTPVFAAYSLIFRLVDNATPAINELWARRETAKLRDVFLRLQRLVLLAVEVIVIGGWFYLRPTVAVWVGPAQYGGDLMTLWLVLFALLTTGRYVSQAFVYATGDIRRFSQIVTVESAVNLALSFWLGSRIGAHGVALATLIAHLPTAGYLQWRAQRDLGVSWPTWLGQTVRPALIAALPTLLVAGLLARLAEPHSWLSLALHALMIGAVHAASAYLLGLTPDDRAVVGRVLARRRA